MPPWTGRARSVYRGPTAAWTEGGAGRGGALTEARPPAAPVHQSSPAGEQKGDRSMGSSAWASPELERRRSDRATAVARRGHGKLGGEGFGGAKGRVARERRGEGRGEVWSAPGVVGLAFIGPGEGTERGGRSNGGVNSH
jgi:hypothetical protein